METSAKERMRKSGHVTHHNVLLMVVGPSGLPGPNALSPAVKVVGLQEQELAQDLILNSVESTAMERHQKPYLGSHHPAPWMVDGANGAVGLHAQCPVASEVAVPAPGHAITQHPLTTANLATPTQPKLRTAQHPHAQLTETGATGVNGADAALPVEWVTRKETGCAIIRNHVTEAAFALMTPRTLAPALIILAQLMVAGQVGLNGQTEAYHAAVVQYQPANVIATTQSQLMAVSIVTDRTLTLRMLPINHALMTVAGASGVIGLPAA